MEWTNILLSVLSGGLVAALANWMRVRTQNNVDLFDRLTIINKEHRELIEQNAKLMIEIGALKQENASLNERLQVQRKIIDELQKTVETLKQTEHEKNELQRKIGYLETVLLKMERAS